MYKPWPVTFGQPSTQNLLLFLSLSTKFENKRWYLATINGHFDIYLFEINIYKLFSLIWNHTRNPPIKPGVSFHPQIPNSNPSFHRQSGKRRSKRSSRWRMGRASSHWPSISSIIDTFMASPLLCPSLNPTLVS